MVAIVQPFRLPYTPYLHGIEPNLPILPCDGAVLLNQQRRLDALVLQLGDVLVEWHRDPDPSQHALFLHRRLR